MDGSKATMSVCTSAISQQSKRRISERFTCEFERDFKGIGISLDVDDEGRLVVLEVKRGGEAAAFVDLQQSNLHIVNVGVASKHTKHPADELLRQLITLPRPVRVEFAKTMALSVATVASAAAVAKDGDGAGAAAVDEKMPPRSPSTRAKPKHPTLGSFRNSDSKSPNTLNQDPVPVEAALDENLKGRRGGSDGERRSSSRRSPDLPSQSRGILTGGGTACVESLQSRVNTFDHGQNVDGNNDGIEGVVPCKPPQKFHSVDAGQGQRVSEPIESNHDNRKTVEASEHVTGIPAESKSSINRWLQEDSDCSNEDSEKIIPRHSWYTANRMRGGHAPDVKRVNSIALVSALARVRKTKEEHQTPCEAETAAAAGSAHGDSRIGLPKVVKAKDNQLPVGDRTGIREFRGSSSDRQSQNTHDALGKLGVRKTAEISLIDQPQNAAVRGIAADDESLDFVPRFSFIERDDLPVEQKVSKEGWRVENTRQTPSDGDVSTTQPRFPPQFFRGDLTANGTGTGGASTPSATSSAVGSPPDITVTGIKKPGAEKRLTAAAFSFSYSLKGTPGGAAIRKPRRISSESEARKTPRESKRKIGGIGLGRDIDGAAATGVSRQKEKLGRCNVQGLQNPSPLSGISPLSPVPDPATASGLDSAVDEGGPPPLVEGTISSLIENYTPFLRRWSMKSGAASEEAVGRWSFAAPMETQLSASHADPPAPPAFGNVPPAHGESKPSNGPVNPRAMYGQVPPPVNPGKDLRRRPSVIVLSEQATKDEYDFRRSKSAMVTSGAGQSRRAVSDAQVFAGRGNSDGDHAEVKTAVGSSSVSLSHALDGIGYKVEKIKLLEKKNMAQGEAQAMQAQTRQTGGSAAMPNASAHRNEPQQVAGELFGDIDDILNSPSRTSWERQLRPTSGTMNHSGTTTSRPRKADKRSTGCGIGLAAKRGGGRGGALPIREKLNSAKSSVSARLFTSPAEPASNIPPPTAWSGPRVDVNHTPPWHGARQSATPRNSARAEVNRQSSHGLDDARQKQQQQQEKEEEEKVEEETSLDRGRYRPSIPSARAKASRTRNARETCHHWVSSNSRAPGLELQLPKPSPAAKVAATTATATATAAAASAAAATAVMTAALSGDNREGWTGAVQAASLLAIPASTETQLERSVARVCVRVRSSVYAVAVELNEKGSFLLQEVAEVEKLRHGIRAARVMGLMNESTGDEVDLDAPARRSLSSGDDLTAVVVRTKSGGRGEAGLMLQAVRKAGGSCNREDQAWMIRQESVEVTRGRSAKQQAGASREISSPLHNVDRYAEISGSRLPAQRRNTPPSEIDKLRDDVARQIFTERRAAGEGIGAFYSQSKPLGSSPITPVTGGGRGASPGNSRVTSPRSASPRGAPKGPGKSVERERGGEEARTSRPGSPARSERSVASGYTHYSGFSVRTHGRAARSQGAFMVQSTLSPEELDGILEEELQKNRKWSNRHRTAQEKSRRVREERSSDYRRLQSAYEEAETARRDKIQRQQEVEAKRMAVRNRQRAVLAESARQQARNSRDSKHSRAKEVEAAHREHLQRIMERKERENRELADRVQMIDRKREDVRDAFLDMVDNENETAIQALETPVEMLDRAVDEGNSVLEKRARRAILRQQARERVHLRQRAAKVLSEQRSRESTAGASSRTKQEIESSMMPGPGHYNIRDFSEYGGGTYSRPLV